VNDARFISLTEKRFESFHAKCKELAKSERSFAKNFLVDRKHILKGALEKNPKRSGVQDSDIAAIIMQGRLIIDACDSRNPIEIAIEGRLNDFKWINRKSSSPEEKSEPFVQVRIVLRDKKPIFVVTVYVWDTIQNREFIEVNREIWT